VDVWQSSWLFVVMCAGVVALTHLAAALADRAFFFVEDVLQCATVVSVDRPAVSLLC
jgi:hypothetical protein